MQLRRWIPFRTRARLLAAALAVAALILGGIGTAPSGATASYHPETGFGGYNWFGTVNQISGHWRVPAISPTSGAGHASTWVGAQDDSGNPPFIQLGTTEDRFDGVNYYNAFWSDAAIGYHPHWILQLTGGDAVSANMTRVSDGWALTFVDLTIGHTKKLTVHYGTGGTFDQAEWLQEDPTANNPTVATDLPYPDMAPVAFSHVKVNGKTPQLHREDGATLLATGGIFLVPSAERDGAFSLDPPTGPAKAYLVAASTLDAELSVFQVATLHWSSHSKAQRKVIASTLAAAYKANAFDLAFYRWPANGRKDARAILQADQQIQRDIKTWIASGLSLNSNAYDNMSVDQGDAPLAQRLRADLGLPPP